VRQILGWREFVRGVYWMHMPGYIRRNALRAQLPVPKSYWDGDTDMACVADAMRNVLDNGYAHHIQRLMVLGLFALNAGVHPRAFNDWHMAMYLDAIDWVSLPNALGMSQFGDGGILGTKPYCASGNYINKMSNYCKNCRFDYRKAAGDDACPVTTLYWDFLDRNANTFEGNQRMVFQLKNLEKKRNDSELMAAIREQAKTLRARIHQGERI
jgi:deoxyribodipyrimidine photolyase-related protein